MKKVLSILLAVLMICSTGSIAFAEDDTQIIAEGTCGTTVSWSLDFTGRMTVSGSGPMQNYWYTEDQRPPYETYKDQVTSLVIEEGVTAVGKYAFYNFKNLTGQLVFPESLRSIRSNAFEGCEGLTQAPQFNETLRDIEFAAFRSCRNMKGDLVIPDSVTNLGIQAFSHCSGLDGTLSIGRNVQTLYGGVFQYCSGLQGDIVIPDSVTSVNVGAFTSCKGFHGTLHIGSSVTRIEPFAFAYCENLTGDLTIPDSVTEIGSAAFYSCTGLDGTLTLSRNLERLYEESYQYGAFQSCWRLKGDLVLPDTLKVIGKNSFYACRGLSGVLNIPDSVETIGAEAFHGCALDTDSLLFFFEHPEYIDLESRITEPTCTVAGSVYRTLKCAECGSILKTWNERLDPAHNLTAVPAAEATVQADGNIAHYACSACGGLFTDADGTEPTTAEAVTIHYPDTPEMENCRLESDGQPASFDLVTRCLHDGTELERETVILETHPAVDATPEGNGNVKYYTDENGTKYVYDEEAGSFAETEDVSTAYPIVMETEIQMNTIAVSFAMNGEYTLIATVLPEKATFKDVTYTVDDPSIVQVDANGKLTPKAVGVTYVHVTSHHGLTVPIYIQVRHGHVEGEPHYEEITVEPTCTTNGIGVWVIRCEECGEIMRRRGPEAIPATGIHLTEFVPAREPSEEADGYTQHYICSSCHGLFKDEEATQSTTAEEIVLHYADEPRIENSKLESESQPATFEVVTYCLHDGTELDRKSVTLEPHPVVEPSLSGDGNVKYYTDTEGGKYVYDEESETFRPTDDVTVPFVPVAVDKLLVNADELHLLIGDTFQLETTTEPENATFPQVIFTSSDESVAAVSPSGLITAKGEGTATIECRTYDGAAATVTVIVQHEHTPGDPAFENRTKEPTCCETGIGDLVTRCTVCGEELSREADVQIPATGNHVPDEGSKTDEVKGTCETEGSYVLIVKCKDCGEVLSSETISTGYGDHAWNDGDVKSGKYDKFTVTDYTCQCCGQHRTEKTRNPNYQFRCKRCDWYDARRNTPGIRGFVYRMIHEITHTVQKINVLS